MDYIKEIEKNNVGLKTTLKKIFKDIDKKITDATENNTTGDNTTENTSPTKVIVSDSVDISNFKLDNIRGSIINNVYFSGGSVKFVVPRDNLDKNLIIQREYLSKFSSKVNIGNLSVNQVKATISNINWSYTYDKDLEITIAFSTPSELIDDVTTPTTPAYDVNVISVDVTNTQTNHTIQWNGKFDKNLTIIEE